jgi:Peptidase A4 family
MNFKTLIPVSAAVFCALGAVPAWMSVASADVQQAESANWSGYVIGSGSSTGGSSSGSAQQFSAVAGSWVQPTAKCTGGSGNAAFWVGLGGAGQSAADATGFGDGSGGGGLGQSSDGRGASRSDSLEQAGTESDCAGDGTPSYFAWYELVPAAPVKLDLAIHAGDHISTRVSISASNMIVAMTNQTTGQSTTKTVPTHNPDTSTAEWIAEAPSECDGRGSCTPLTLTDFGTVSFTGASATTASGHTGTISDPAWSAAAVQLNPQATSAGLGGAQFASTGGSGGASPSSLSSDGSSFSVAYSSSTQPASTGAGSGYGDGSGGSSDPYGYGSGDPYGYGSGGGPSDPYGYGSGDGSGDPYGYGSGGGSADPYGYGSGAGDPGYAYGAGGYAFGAGGYDYGAAGYGGSDSGQLYVY